MIYYAAALLAGLFYTTSILPAQWVQLRRVKHSLHLNKKILQISDMHVEKLRVSPAKLKAVILEEKPDLIMLTGDYTQYPRYIGKVDTYLKAICEPGIPVYAVLGNHDYRLGGSLWKLLRIFQEHGIPVLRNESVAEDGFRLVAIDDDYSGHSDVRKSFRGVRPGEVCVVITHDPTVTLKIKRPYDYLMSGHFHGGQFRVPFVFHVRKKGPLPLKGIVDGLHRDDHGTFFISKGLGQTGLNLRFLIRSELTIHEL